MTTDDEPISLTLQLYAPPDADDEEVFNRTRYLRNEIEDLPIDKAQLVKTQAPEGAKAGEAIMIGTMAIAALPTFLAPLIDLVRDWLSRPRNQDIRIKARLGDDEIEISYPSTAAPQIDVQQWLETVLAKRQAASIKNQSGGIGLEANHVGVGGDMVAGDKIVSIQTLIVNAPPSDTQSAADIEEYQ
jgi:hypothetical protein